MHIPRSAPQLLMAVRAVLLSTLALAPTHAKEPIDASKWAKIDERMNEFVDQHQISGVVTLVANADSVLHHSAVGLADVEQSRAMQKDTLFSIASMTKPITAAAVMILQDEGRLSIDDAVSKYIPEFKLAKLKDAPAEREITIRDVLTHTSGLGGEQQNMGTLKETGQKLAQRPLDFQPGTRWQYSPGLSVCGCVVEAASGQPFDVFLQQRIFQPLGMAETSFNPTSDQQKRVARLYKPGPDKQSLVPTTHWINDLSSERTPNPSGGLFSTATDLVKFYQMMLNGGELNGKRILSAEAVQEMTRVQTGELTTGFTPGNGWGLGVCIVRQPQGATAMLSPGSYGHGGAFGTQGWIDPQRQLIFVLLIQRTEFGNSDASELRGDFQRLAVEAVGG